MQLLKKRRIYKWKKKFAVRSDLLTSALASGNLTDIECVKTGNCIDMRYRYLVIQRPEFIRWPPIVHHDGSKNRWSRTEKVVAHFFVTSVSHFKTRIWCNRGRQIFKDAYTVSSFDIKYHYSILIIYFEVNFVSFRCFKYKTKLIRVSLINLFFKFITMRSSLVTFYQ